MLLSDLLITALVFIPEFSGESCTGLCSVVCYDVRNTLISCNYRSFYILQKENRTYCNSSDLLVCCTAFAVFLYLNFIKASTSAVIDLSNFTWQATLKKIGTSIFNFNYDTTPLWYLYMLIGVYLFIPIIGVWLNTASAKDIRLFLVFWVISLMVPYIKMAAPLLGYTGNYDNAGIWGVCNWNEFGTFYYFSGFLGYIILAYYLVKYPLNWSWNKTLAVAIPLFVIGYGITFSGFLITQKYFPANYANLEIVWYFCNINVAMMTFAMFIVFQKINIKESKLLKNLSSATFGIFLCHFILVQAFTDVFLHLEFLPATVRILCIAIVSFLVSYGVTELLSSNKLTRRFVK